MNNETIRLALRPSTIKRAFKYAVVVGSVLIVINHGDALVAGEISAARVARMGLTVIVPYVVSTLSSVGALRERNVPHGSSGVAHNSKRAR
jgi:hypothetical protein